MKISLTFILTVIQMFLLTTVTESVEYEYDSWGGIKFAEFDATGFFRVENDNDTWWLITPEGHPFYSVGVCAINPHGAHSPALGYAPYGKTVTEKYDSHELWARGVEKRLLKWGFNSKGAWCNEVVRIPEFVMIYFSGDVWGSGKIPDYFSNEFITVSDEKAKQHVRPEDPSVIAYFVDNELQWNTDWRRGPSLFDGYFNFAPDAPGKIALMNFFSERYQDVSDFNIVWDPSITSWSDLLVITQLTPRPDSSDQAKSDMEEFTYLVAKNYFRVVTGALRKYDSNHLIAGARFVSWTTPVAVVRAAGEFCDIVSVNHYELGPAGKQAMAQIKSRVELAMSSPPDFRIYHDATGKPVLITEFSFRANDSGMPNTYPPPLFAQPTVPTQEARAHRYERYAKLWASRKYIVGQHWYKYFDAPKEGRFDGENGNYGLVDNNDNPYSDFVNYISGVNSGLWRVHLDAGSE